jgi:hypothetical protein
MNEAAIDCSALDESTMNNNPKIVFVASLFTSKIFWAQVVAIVATLATMSGFHPGWATEANQAELVGMIDMFATTALRIWGFSGPVSLTAPISALAPQELTAGVHTVTVTPPVPVPAPVPVLTISSAPLPGLAPVA